EVKRRKDGAGSVTEGRRIGKHQVGRDPRSQCGDSQYDRDLASKADAAGPDANLQHQAHANPLPVDRAVQRITTAKTGPRLLPLAPSPVPRVREWGAKDQASS